MRGSSLLEAVKEEDEAEFSDYDNSNAMGITSTSVSEIHGLDRLHFVTIQRRKAYEDELERIRASQKDPLQEPPKISLWRRLLRKLNLSDDLDLHTSVMIGNVLVVERTLRRLDQENSFPDAYNFKIDGMTALSVAIKGGREDIAAVLINERNVSVQAQDNNTLLTPLHHAVYLDLQKIACLIISRKDDGLDAVNLRDTNGITPLALACSLGRYNICRDLLRSHADPDICDVYGWNALFFAAYGGNRNVVKLILDCGIEKGAVDKTGRLAIDIATRLKHSESIALLETYNAQLS